MKKHLHYFIISFSLLFCDIPDRRVVAEWEPAIGTMVRWPLGIPSELVIELASGDILFVLVETENQQNQATNSFDNWEVNLENVVFIYTDTYSHWTRDHGPQFIIGENHWKVVNQQFNGYPENAGCNFSSNESSEDSVLGYGGRNFISELRGWEEDDDTNIDFANQMNWTIQDLPLYWTGGNFMTDGYGQGFSTELMVNENNISNQSFKEIMYQELYFSNYHIFENPNEQSIQHIDCLAKIVNPETIIIKQVPESSPEYNCIEEFAESFYELNTFYERPFDIHRILCPNINGGWWETNPVAAYTNSLILNDKVLVPQYGILEDMQALQTYRDAMPGYEVIGFDDTFGNPWYAEDALHCRVMGIFDPNMMHISHKTIRNNDDDLLVEAEIIDYGNTENSQFNVELYWKYSANDGPFSQIALQNNSFSESLYNAEFPILNPNSEIEYFIVASNASGQNISHPNSGWHTFTTQDYIPGDINGDQTINVQDIVLAVNLALNSEYFPAADLNADEAIDILDIVLLINIILE